MSFRSRIWPVVRTGLKGIGWLSMGGVITHYGVSFASISGGSMAPTFNPDQYKNPTGSDVVLLNRYGFSHGRYDTRGRLRRGDVVTLWSPLNPELLTTKRIVALEGDVVKPLPPSTAESILIPEGHCWVEGDSVHRTIDSNTYGPIPVALITGRVEAIVWPWERIQWVEPGPGKSEGRVRHRIDRFVWEDGEVDL